MTKQEAIYKLRNTAWLAPQDDTSVGEAVEMACEALTVDIIRCKDCKWWGTSACALWIVNETDCPQENDFCSFGERGEP